MERRIRTSIFPIAAFFQERPRWLLKLSSLHTLSHPSTQAIVCATWHGTLANVSALFPSRLPFAQAVAAQRRVVPLPVAVASRGSANVRFVGEALAAPLRCAPVAAQHPMASVLMGFVSVARVGKGGVVSAARVLARQ